MTKISADMTFSNLFSVSLSNSLTQQILTLLKQLTFSCTEIYPDCPWIVLRLRYVYLLRQYLSDASFVSWYALTFIPCWREQLEDNYQNHGCTFFSLCTCQIIFLIGNALITTEFVEGISTPRRPWRKTSTAHRANLFLTTINCVAHNASRLAPAHTKWLV